MLKFQDSISNENWDSLYCAKISDPNTAYKHFLGIFMYHYELAFPLVKTKSKEITTKSWLTKGIIIASRKKRELHKLSKLSNDVNFIQYMLDLIN